MSGPAPQRIVVLGGGFAGVYTAMELERALSSDEQRRVEITIVSSENYIVFQPLLPEVISGTIETLHCISPIRRLVKRARVITRDVEAIDLGAKQVRLAPGSLPKPMLLQYDHLVLGLGTRLNYALAPGMREHAIPFKYLGDALRLRNEAVRALEEADIATDPVEKQRLLTFVVAGGGFSGVECLAELNDFLRNAVRAYRRIEPDEIRCVLLQSGERILPELDASLAGYAHDILTRRGVEIRLQTRLKAVSATSVIVAHQGRDEQIAARTVVTTVPAAPHPLIESLACEKDRGRVKVNEFLAAVGCPGLWAVGDCAAVPQRDGIMSPPTAQHAVRQAKVCAKNIVATLRERPLKPFLFTGLGKLASLGRHQAVADIGGLKVRGLLAWLFWRGVYLSKFPGLERKTRIAMDWLLDMVLPRDITQVRIFPADSVETQQFHAGEVVFDEGDVGDKLYVIVSGQLEVVRGGQTLAQLGPGEVCGEMALVSDRPRNATVRAATAATVVTVSRAAFGQLVTHLPGVRSAIEEIMAAHNLPAPQPGAALVGSAPGAPG